MENVIITVLVGIACGFAGFGLSQLLAVVALKSKVDVNSSKINSLGEERGQTNKLLTAIVNQNTKLLAHMGIKDA